MFLLRTDQVVTGINNARGKQGAMHLAQCSAHPKNTGLEQPTHTPEPGLTATPGRQSSNGRTWQHMHHNPGTPGAAATNPIQGS